MEDFLSVLLVLYYVAALIFFPIVCATLAIKEERNAVIWFILGLLFTVFAFALLAVLCHPSRRSSQAQGLPAGRGKICPGCAKVIPERSRFCLHCWHEFAATDDRSADARRQPPPRGTDQAASETGRYRGIDYAVFADGSVAATLRGRLQTWASLDAFRWDVDHTGFLPPDDGRPDV